MADQVYKTIILLTAITFILEFAGLPTGLDVFKDWLGLFNGTVAFSLSNMFDSVSEILTGFGIITGIAIGYLIRNSPESAIVTPFVITLMVVTANTFKALIDYTQGMGFVHSIVWIVFTPLMVGSIFSLIKFWRGVD